MSKTLALFSDGTGNSAAKAQGTNVRRLYEAVDRSPLGAEQVTFYDDGVGTESIKPIRLLGGAFGYGITRNLEDLYGFLLRHYVPGDKVLLFGFSRGAFTVRCLANILWYVGLPDPDGNLPEELKALAKEAIRAYKKRAPGDRDSKAPRDFREKYHGREVPIEMLGVWDTVEAVGLPIHELTEALRQAIPLHLQTIPARYRKPGGMSVESDFNPLIKSAYHALSIDDERRTFHPLLIQEDNKCAGRVEQVWFAGVHSNVGGGYPKDGLAYITMRWMAHRAQDHGLILSKAQVQAFADMADIDDNLYDSRSGFGVFYRYAPRPIGDLCAEAGVVPHIHASAIERVRRRTEDYAPHVIPPNAVVAQAPDGFPGAGDAVLREQLLRPCDSLVRTGRLQYLTFFWLCCFFAVLLLEAPCRLPLPSWLASFLAVPEGWGVSVARYFLPVWAANRLAAVAAVPGWMTLFALAGLVLLVWTRAVDAYMGNLCSAAWEKSFGKKISPLPPRPWYVVFASSVGDPIRRLLKRRAPSLGAGG